MSFGHNPRRHRHRGGFSMQRRLFFWFGAAIFGSALVFAGVAHLQNSVSSAPWQRHAANLSHFVAERFAEVWDDTDRRAQLTAAIAQDFQMDVAVRDTNGVPLHQIGPCLHPWLTAEVKVGAKQRGSVTVCPNHVVGGGFWRLLLPFSVAACLLWAISGRVARRLTRPLADLSHVASDIGNGKLKTRAVLGCREPGEIGALARSINDMAVKIEKQMSDQRELLAGVSHELRSPLARLRVMLELLPELGTKKHGELEREIIEMDALVGALLANARLDFAALTLHDVDGAALAKQTLERAGLSTDLLQIEATNAGFSADPTLVARALANIIDNAQKHGGGLIALVLKRRPGLIVFEARDKGPGFAGNENERVFQPFYHAKSGQERPPGSIGLGLSLVRRIAEAHHGCAYARNGDEGAVVGFEIAASADY